MTNRENNADIIARNGLFMIMNTVTIVTWSVFWFINTVQDNIGEWANLNQSDGKILCA